ncbi:MAG: SUMF1/EgtB/PvdO family nonheme iron enzyme [Rhodoferax sp.]|nr:SUMF1/EgtB/PvdO family nonheme iron enzyme [Rhodoferax sp.]
MSESAVQLQQTGKGLGRMDAPSGAVIAFATAPGKTASDNTAGRNGLYTKHLIAAINTPGLRLEDVFKRVGAGVEKESAQNGGDQSPEEVMKLRSEQPFYFKGGAGTQVASIVPEPVVPPQPPVRPVAPVTPTAGQTLKDCDVCPELVVVPGGSFEMGSNAAEQKKAIAAGASKEWTDWENPQHRVNVQSFAMGKYEVTQGQWKAVMGSNPSYFKDCGDTCPVEQVSWDDAQEYIKKLNARSGKQYRLPSEAQWEYAARAGTTTAFSTGETITTAQANFDGNYTYNGSAKGVYREKPIKVGSFAPNDFGLYDMHGNVWEWVQDCWNDSYKGAPSDGSAWESGACGQRAVRGGSWLDIPADARAAVRYRSDTTFRNNLSGVRLARMLP